MDGSSSRAILAKRIGWLVQYYQHEKPKHRAVLQLVDGEKPVAFHPGKLLDQLKKCFLPDTAGTLPQPLSQELREQCLSLWWFQGWLDELVAKRSTGNEDGPPDLEEQVHLLIQSYHTTAPRKGEAVTVERINGAAYELNGHALLEKIAPNFHGDDLEEKNKHYIGARLQQQLIVLPWSDDWLATGRKRREVARMRKLVTKELKVELILYYFRDKKPVWKSRIPVRVPDESGGVFEFFPGTWLDDLADNYLKEARPNVVLTESQMLAISSLSWFDEWLNSVRYQREMRGRKSVAGKRARRPSAEYDVDTEETYETDCSVQSQQENSGNKCVRVAKAARPSLTDASVAISA